MLFVALTQKAFPIISALLSYSWEYLLFSKLCWHNLSKPTYRSAEAVWNEVQSRLQPVALMPEGPAEPLVCRAAEWMVASYPGRFVGLTCGTSDLLLEVRGHDDDPTISAEDNLPKVSADVLHRTLTDNVHTLLLLYI